MNKLILFIFISIILSESYDSCIIPKGSRDISRNNFTYPETIQSDNFVIHLTYCFQRFC